MKPKFKITDEERRSKLAMIRFKHHQSTEDAGRGKHGGFNNTDYFLDVGFLLDEVDRLRSEKNELRMRMTK